MSHNERVFFPFDRAKATRRAIPAWLLVALCAWGVRDHGSSIRPFLMVALPLGVALAIAATWPVLVWRQAGLGVSPSGLRYARGRISRQFTWEQVEEVEILPSAAGPLVHIQVRGENKTRSLAAQMLVGGSEGVCAEIARVVGTSGAAVRMKDSSAVSS